MGAWLTPLAPLGYAGQTMAVSVPVEDDEYGGSHAEPVTVTNVRFERVAERRALHSSGATGGYVISDDLKGRIYVDAATSGGAFEVPEGSKVSVDGGEPMEVVRTSRFEDFAGRVHHWELEVR